MTDTNIDRRQVDAYQTGFAAAKLDMVITGIDKLSIKLDSLQANQQSMSTSLSQLIGKVGELESDSKDHEARMRKLESSDKWYSAAAVAVSLLLSYIAKLLWG